MATIRAHFDGKVFVPEQDVECPENVPLRLTVEVAGDRNGGWQSLSIEELIDQQRVAPATDLDEISELWPVDDDPDELLQHLKHERDARRQINPNTDAE